MDQLIQKIFLQDPIALSDIVIALPLALFLGGIISWVYRHNYHGGAYNSGFNFTLIMVSLIVTIIMMTIKYNLALSLGLVGSLSIIRFRAVLKDTSDMAYLFWAIASGLIVGGGNYRFSLLSTFFVSTVVFFVSGKAFKRFSGDEYILIIHIDYETKTEAIHRIISMYEARNLSWEIQSSHIDGLSETQEIIYHITGKDLCHKTDSLLNEMKTIEGVQKVSLISSEANQFVG